MSSCGDAAADERHVRQVALRGRLPLVGRLAVPLRCLVEIARDAPALLVEQAQVGLRPRIALVGRLAEPARRGGRIGVDAIPPQVHVGERQLRVAIALLGRRLEFAQRRRVVAATARRVALRRAGLGARNRRRPAPGAAQAGRWTCSGTATGARTLPDADRFEGRDARTGEDGHGQAGNGFISGGSPRRRLARRIRGRWPRRTARPDATQAARRAMHEIIGRGSDFGTGDCDRSSQACDTESGDGRDTGRGWPPRSAGLAGALTTDSSGSVSAWPQWKVPRHYSSTAGVARNEMSDTSSPPSGSLLEPAG